MLETFRRPALIIGVSASLLLHVLASVILYTAAPAMPEPVEEPILVDFDMDEAPPPPEAEMPSASDEPVPQPAPAEVAQPEETVPAPEPEAEPEPEGIAAFDAAPEHDAGPADAMPADATPGNEHDAGPADAGADEVLAAKNGDAGAVAAAPADAGVADAGAVAGARPGADHDAAPVAATTPGPASDAGPGGATASTPGAGEATAGTGAGPGTSELNLLAYLPPGDVVSVLVRFDRLRGKPWAAQAEAILAPMPDYRSLVGDRAVTVSDLFDFLVISTPEPREVTATTLVGRTRLSGPEVRKFIDHPGAPVTWYTSRGGPAGRRTPSQLVHPSDKRLFVLPEPGWVVLAQPKYLGVLPQPVEGDIDMAMASQADLPDWLARAPAIDELTGKKDGPVLMLTIQGMLPPRYQTPYLGEFDTPKRLTLAIESARVGFVVRGAMLFETEAQAEAFIAALTKAKNELTTTPMGKLLLNRFHVFHALRGLSFKRNRLKVAFSTSISGNDARGLLDRTAVQVRTYFEAQREPTRRLKRPRPATEPAPAEPGPSPASPAPASPAPATPAPAP